MISQKQSATVSINWTIIESFYWSVMGLYNWNNELVQLSSDSFCVFLGWTIYDGVIYYSTNYRTQ